MIVSDIVDALASALSIGGVTVYRYAPDSIVEPAIIIPFPKSISYDATYGRGADDLTQEVHVVAGRVVDADALVNLGPFCDGDGAQSIKALLELDGSLGEIVNDLQVSEATFGALTIGGVDYLAATFTVDVFA